MTKFNNSASHISMMHSPYGPRIHMDENAPSAPPATVERVAPSDTPAALSVAQAARTLASLRRKPAASDAPAAGNSGSTPASEDAGAAGDSAGTNNEAAESAEQATAANTESTSQEGDAARSEATATGENQTEEKTPAPEKAPPRPLPRSWTKDQNDNWAKLDPAVQDFLLEQDRKASEAVRRSQNEAAEKAKALTAKEQAAEQARTDFENRAKAALNVLLRDQQRDFPDVRNMDDVLKMSKEDPYRYLQWQAHQQELQAQAAQVQEAERRSAEAAQAKRTNYFTEQTARLKELVPDFADEAKFAAARNRALPLLEEYGFSGDQLQKWAATDAGFEILQSAGFQKLVADTLAARDRDAKFKATEAKRAAEEAKRKEELKKKVVPAAVPPVQRPGTPATPGDTASVHINTLSKNLSQTGSLKDGLALLRARRANG